MLHYGHPTVSTRVREIQATTMLAHVRQPEPWFGLRYNMNLYRGCQHRCIYCDSRSLCYGIEDFDGEVLVKGNAIDLLGGELARKRVRGTIGLGSMNDPYMPLERARKLTRSALKVIADLGFGVHVLTKSDLVVRDADLLSTIARTYARVTFTITTTDDDLARKVEPVAPSPSARLRAMRELAGSGIEVGVAMMPVLPFLEDTAESVSSVVREAAASGASYVIPGLGMTLRDRQREYYYARLDEWFPGLRHRYERAYGQRYSCAARNAAALHEVVASTCRTHGVAMGITPYRPGNAIQPPLL